VIRQRGWAAPHALNGRSQTCSSCPGLLTAAAAGRGSGWSNSPLSLRSRRAPRFRALGGMPRGAQRCCGLCNKPLSVTAECRVQSALDARPTGPMSCHVNRSSIMCLAHGHHDSTAKSSTGGNGPLASGQSVVWPRSSSFRPGPASGCGGDAVSSSCMLRCRCMPTR
jgi:hypothetical protein